MLACLLPNRDRLGVDLDEREVGRNWEACVCVCACVRVGVYHNQHALYEKNLLKKEMQKWILYILQTTYLFATSSILPKPFNSPGYNFQWHIFTVTLHSQ